MRVSVSHRRRTMPKKVISLTIALVGTKADVYQLFSEILSNAQHIRTSVIINKLKEETVDNIINLTREKE